MLEILDKTKDNVIITKAKGKLTSQDYAKLHPVIENIVERGEKVSWYFEMENFSGWELPAMWEDVKLDVQHANDFDKIAMVGNKDWQDWMTKLVKPFVSAEVKYFEKQDKEAAKKWIEN